MEFTKKQLIWGILLYGTLIGLNESVIGSFGIPYRSIILSTITLTLLSFARFQFPKPGTSLLIITIALLFKINSSGFHTCTMGYLMCGPMALLLLGTGYEIFASLIIRRVTSRIYIQILICCMLTSMIMFACFALFQLYIVKDPYWTGDRFGEYIFIKGPVTAAASSLLSVMGVLLIERMNPSFIHLLFKRPVMSQWILGLFIAALWVAGYFAVQ
jgi:hypothetical protein